MVFRMSSASGNPLRLRGLYCRHEPGLKRRCHSNPSSRAVLYSDGEGDSRNDPPVTVPGRSCVYCHATVPEPWLQADGEPTVAGIDALENPTSRAGVDDIAVLRINGQGESPGLGGNPGIGFIPGISAVGGLVDSFWVTRAVLGSARIQRVRVARVHDK